MTARSCYWLEQERDPAVRPRTNQSGANQRVGVAPWPDSKTPYMHWARPVPIMYVIYSGTCTGRNTRMYLPEQRIFYATFMFFL